MTQRRSTFGVWRGLLHAWVVPNRSAQFPTQHATQYDMAHHTPVQSLAAGAALKFFDPPLAITTRLGGAIDDAALFYVGVLKY